MPKVFAARRRDWLSITPEPEQVLPRAIATLRTGGAPGNDLIEGERREAERLVLHGTRRSWLAWLDRAEQLARRTAPSPDDGSRELVDAARREALAVITNHNALMLGLPGRAEPGYRTATRAQEEECR